MVAPDFQTAVVTLGYTKGGKRKGCQEHVIIDDGNLVQMLAASVDDLQPGDYLFGASEHTFRQTFKNDIKALGLSGSYKPYSFRRGGATHLYRSSANLSAVTTRGRWASSRTARIYIDEAMSELAELRRPLSVSRTVGKYNKIFQNFLS